MPLEPTITADTLASAFDELGQLAHAAGRVIDIAVYGGSCLMLVSNFRVSTGDVDAVAAHDQAFLDSAAQQIAGPRGWPADWLNDGVRTYLSPNVEGFEQHSLFRTYPSEAAPGLRVFVPTPEYMLSGVFRVANLIQAQDGGLTLFWAHRLDQLKAFIEATKT
jgi:hypothetical protein